MKKKWSVALRLTLVLSLFPIAVISSPAANAATAESQLCPSKNVNDGTNVDIFYIPGYCVLKFKSGTVTWTVPSNVTFIEYLVVAGGGAGGRGSSGGCEAGGGGAGGVLTGSMAISPSSVQSITVGAGGTTVSNAPTNGGDTTAFSLTAKGGGYGGTQGINSNAGGSGGSGGGGSHDKGAGGAGTTGQGTSGEQPLVGSSGGGGGGATTSGTRGFGGMGLASAITGSTVYYGDGGAGSHSYITNPPYSNITSGQYGAFRGGSGNGGYGPLNTGDTPGSGAANTGSGGAGAYYCADTMAGGNGGSGVVIVRYPVKPSVNGLEAYFRNDSISGTSAVRNPITTGPEFCHYGVYSSISTNWGESNPRSTGTGDYTYDPASPSACNNDYFHGFYTGYIKTPNVSGTYTFRINADDNYFLDIDSTSVIANESGTAGSRTGTISLQADTIYPIQIYFQELGGGASISLAWTPPGQNEVAVPTQNLGTTVGALQSGAQLNSVCSIGLSQSCPAYSPQEIVNLYGSQSNGTFWLSVNGVASQVYIMMESGFDGGGYVLAMKGANTGATFNYDASYWTKPNVLNSTGDTYLSRNVTNNTDAKFNAFNYLPPRSIAAVFPEQTSTSYTAGGLGSNDVYGFSWLENMPRNASSYLGIFTDTTSHYEILNGSMFSKSVTRQLLREATDKDIGKNPSNNTSIFTRQTNVKFFGFNYRQQEWTTPNTNKARWGFGNNENGVNTDTEIERTNDAIGGIGVSGDVSYSAGDFYNNAVNVTQTGINKATKFEMYLKMADPNLAAPSNLRSSTTGDGNITLSWNKPANTIPTEYVIQYRTSGAANWSTGNSSSLRLLMPSDSATPTTVITGLSRSTKYEFRVFARSSYNLVSNNSSSASTSVLTRLEMPTSIKVMPVSDTDTALVVSFTGTAGADKHMVQVFSDEATTQQVGTTWDTFTSGSRVTGLTANTRYFISVIAANTAGDGNSAPTAVVKGVTPGFSDWTLKTSTGEYAQVPDDSTLDFSGDMTMEAWVYPTGNSGLVQNMVINKDHSFQISHINGYWKYAFYLTDSDTATNVDTGVPVRYNEWHHIAVTRRATNGNVKFYHDGILLHTNTTTGIFTGALRNSSYPLGLGACIPEGSGVSNEFIGQIDQIKLFSSVRTDSEILETDMKTYGSVDTTKLVAFYDFNEGSSNRVFNRAQGTSTNTDATIQGTPQWRTLEDVDTTSLSSYAVTTFKRSYFSIAGGWKAPAGVTKAAALIVGGGGGGSASKSAPNQGAAGAGGGGGVVDKGPLKLSSILSSGRLEIVVGQGGARGVTTTSQEGNQGSPGGQSRMGSISAGGGGGGGGTLENKAGGSGTSGGGGGGTSYFNNAGQPGIGAAGTAAIVDGVSFGGDTGGNGFKAVGFNNGGAGGGARGTADTSTAGAGAISSITGSSVTYGAGGSAEGVTGFTFTEALGAPGRGGDGNPSGGSGGNLNGAHGSNGIIILRWLVITKPTFTSPSSDTTTAQIYQTFTASNNPLDGMSRSFQWFQSTDSGTTFTTISGATLESYSAYAGVEYIGTQMRFKVQVTDTDTYGLSVSDTSTPVTLKINPVNVISGSWTAKQYGNQNSATFTSNTNTGTGNKTFIATYAANAKLTVDTSTANTIVFTIDTSTGVGDLGLIELRVVDAKGATAVQNFYPTVLKADTLTVTALAKSDTYTGSALSFTPTFTVSGLINSDTITAAAMSWNYSGTDNSQTAYSLQSTKPINAGSYTITPVPPTSVTKNYWGPTIVTAPLTINRASRVLTETISATSVKYGSTLTLSSSVNIGSAFGSTTYATSTSDSCTVSGTTITAIKPSGTCSFTATISQTANYETATSTAKTATLTQADTVTVQLRNPVTTVYSPSGPSTLPTLTISGLVLNDSATSTRLYTAGTLINSSSVPVDAETYTVTASTLTFTSGSLANYVNVVYETSTLTITKAVQSKLSINMYGAVAGSPYFIQVLGGLGTGGFTYSVEPGSTATNCRFEGSTLRNDNSASDQKACNIAITKLASQNYSAETLTATIYFLVYVNNQANNQIGSGSTIALPGATALTINDSSTVRAPIITSFSLSGSTLTINGEGFGNSPLSVVFEVFRSATSSTPTGGGTTFTVTVPADAVSGPVLVNGPGGQAFTEWVDLP